MENSVDWLILSIGVLGIFLAFSYFGHRLFWSIRWGIASIRKDKEKAHYAETKSVSKINWVLLLVAVFCVFLYKFLSN